MGLTVGQPLVLLVDDEGTGTAVRVSASLHLSGTHFPPTAGGDICLLSSLETPPD